MKTILAALLLMGVLSPTSTHASPSARSAKAEISGTVVDFDKRECILVLKPYQGWDRKQMELPNYTDWAKTRRWLAQFDKTHAAVLIKKDDMAKIKKGMRVKIEGYTYFYDEWAVYGDYDKITLSK